MIAGLRRASQGLAFRIAALLAFALMPIGIIALSQTLQLIKESNRKAEATLLALTSKAAGGEEGLIRTAYGAAQAIGAFVPDLRDDPEICQTMMNRYLQASDAFSFVGYIDANGTVACASAGEGMNFSDSEIFREMRDDPRPRTAMVESAPVTGMSVISIMMPVLNGTAFDGYVTVSLPHRRLSRGLETLTDNQPVDLVTFNDSGVVLTSKEGLDGVEQRLPRDRALAEFVGKPQIAFTGLTEAGDKRVFAVVPVVSNLVYAIGSWKHDRLAFAPGALNLAMPILFPVLMWLACLGVAFFAVERLVIRPTRNLRARMLLFMRSRQISSPKGLYSTPRELREIDETWERMARSVLMDEAHLEDTIHDKNVLLKEVHHRVKNNLQLISSILNMMIRKATTNETRLVLQDVQNRVMSLATVHQNLHETSAEGRVRADELLKAIAGRIIMLGLPSNTDVQIEQEFQPAVLYPDQAVPLTLATAEAVTNALKYVGRPSHGKPWIRIRLTAENDEMYKLEIANSTGDGLNEAQLPPGSKLGTQLITAFAHQLDGQFSCDTEGETYRVLLAFRRPVITDEELIA